MLRHGHFLCLFVVGYLAALSSGNAAAQTVLTAADRGWYKQDGVHSTVNKNTITGRYSTNTYNSYFYFNIPAGISCVGSATLELELERYYGDGAPHDLEIYDVMPSHLPLINTNNGSGSGVAIHNDLRSGALYASMSGVTAAQVGSLLSLNLSPQALTDIATASGGAFAVGGFVIPGGTGSLRALRFSASNESRIHRLTLQPCTAGAPEIILTKDSSIGTASAGFAVPGEDVTYVIALANEGTANTDAGSMFLVDEMPPEMMFFNGDFDGPGPGTGPVAITDSGSGLTFNQATDLAFSNAATRPSSFSACTYSPTSGYDPNVRFVCLNPKGEMQTAAGPTFSVRFRARIE